MNPYFYAAAIGVASAAKRPSNRHKSSTAVRRRAVKQPRPHAVRRTLKPDRRTQLLRVGIIGALMIAVVVGFILFWLTRST